MPELGFYDTNIPCLAACPVHTNAGMYVAAIADGNDLLAYDTARFPNPLASVCGRVCAAPCEDACRRGLIDEPIAIRALKRFVTEKYGVEAGPASRWSLPAPVDPAAGDRSVGIVGGGPAGLAAAHDLRRLGYRVSLYEARAELGGMMVLGIPEYRLDRRLLRAEIDAIVRLGVDVHLETRLGRDVTLDELRERHDAVCITLGATVGRGLDIEGSDADGVFKAIEFLLNVNLGFHVEVGERVVVVGGGNVAMDAARTALRADAYRAAQAAHESLMYEREEERASITEAVDVARTAVRAGARDVTVISLEAAEEMPAAAFEIEEAKKEGIRFLHRRGPARFIIEGSAVAGLETIGVLSVFDAQGRFAPEFDLADRSILEADTVILAIGQGVDLDALGTGGPAVSPRGTISIDHATRATSLPGVWAGGDAAFGPRNLIDAVADGQRIAASIHSSFGGEVARHLPGELEQGVRFRRLLDRYDRRTRVEIPGLPSDRRIGLREVEVGYSEAMARSEAERCLRCFANIQLDVDACVLCGLCADVCPFDLISLVPASEIDPESTGTALLLDESRCIRCALCIERCPTDALSMSTWTGVGVPIPVGAR